jgi:hypothetical protein
VSNDLNIAAIGHEAVVLPKSIGRAIIEVRDKLNPKNADQIEVEVSYVNELVFLEKLKEIVVDEISSVNVFALGGRYMSMYSNCSFLSIDSTIEKDEMVTQIHNKSSYESYLSHLEHLYTSNPFYKKLLETHASSTHLNVGLYDSYIKEEGLKEDFLHKIFRSYRNYGLCSNLVFKGNYRGETNIKVVQNSFF